MNELDDRLDAVFGALSHSVRRQLLRRLRFGSCSLSELAEPFAMTLPAVSKHVRVLEHARLVEREKRGRVHHCSLAPRSLDVAQLWIDEHQRMWDAKLDSLQAFLEHD